MRWLLPLILLLPGCTTVPMFPYDKAFTAAVVHLEAIGTYHVRQQGAVRAWVQTTAYGKDLAYYPDTSLATGSLLVMVTIVEQDDHFYRYPRDYVAVEVPFVPLATGALTVTGLPTGIPNQPEVFQQKTGVTTPVPQLKIVVVD